MTATEPEPTNHGPDREAASLADFGAEASRILGSTLDVENTLRDVARLAVPRIADWCAIDLLEADGTLRPLAVAHEDPAKVSLVEELRRDYPADPAQPIGAYQVVRDRATMTVDVTPEMLAAAAVDERHGRLIATLELHAWMCVPMLSDGRVLGTISFAGAESGRSFGPGHVALAEQLAARAAVALDNARAFQAADRFRRILDAVAEAVFVVDAETGLVRDVNRRALDLLGVTTATTIGREFWGRHVDLAMEAAGPLLEPLLEGRADARTVGFSLLPTVGAPIPAEVLLQAMELPGEARAIVAIARDVRDRMEAQARLERMAESEHARAAELNAVIGAIGDGVIVCAADGSITLANPAAMAILGVRRLDDYRDLVEAVVDADGTVPGLGRTGGPAVVATRADRERWIEVTTYPVPARVAGVGSETIVVLRDVTEARQREAIRETFIGILSHELRTPVTTIYGGAKLLARPDSRVDEATRQTIFDDIVAESERLQRLVEDVVAMNRFGATDGDLGHEPVLLQRLVPGVVASERARWPAVTFELDIPAGLPTVVADPVYVEQVLRNLLSNAAKYGGLGSRVRLALSPGDGEVVVTIEDDGPGIDPAESERLFELFYRSPSTARMTAGAGIGLFVCARLVRAMRGRIWARPREGPGAEFGFALPMMTED